MLLAAMHDRLMETVQRRPLAVVVRCEHGAVEETYASLTQALGESA